MSDYEPPVAEIRFVIEDVLGLDAVRALDGHEDLTGELVGHVLDEAARFGRDVLAPLDQPGDREGCRMENGTVRTPAGFADAYRAFAEAEWSAISGPVDYGGQGLPGLIGTAVSEIWHGANLSFGLCPMLTQSAVELLAEHGSQAQKSLYLPPLTTGRWTGTMDMTEPNAGSDLGGIRTRAERDGDDGRYRIRGQKVFISWGEHDMAENIVHMVLARTPDAPPGTRGLSLFLVPRHLPDETGRPGAPNDVHCVSLERKMGMHASPTCVMAYGDRDGAVGWLIGEENGGLACMFTMMNRARLAVGIEGIAAAEQAWQRARAYASERVQGRPAGSDGETPAPIVHHPDVRRMLLAARARTRAARGLAYHAALCLDRAERHPNADERAAAAAQAGLLTPVVKAWATETGIAVANAAIQVHGGLGYVEDTGAAQHLRDARVTAIYEGTNGIQAADLVGRKVVRDDGAAVAAFLGTIAETETRLQAADDPALTRAAGRLTEGRTAIQDLTRWLVDTAGSRPDVAAAAAAGYLRAFGTLAGGWMLARGAISARKTTSEPSWIASTQYFAGHDLAAVPTAAANLPGSAETVARTDPDAL